MIIYLSCPPYVPARDARALLGPARDAQALLVQAPDARARLEPVRDARARLGQARDAEAPPVLPVWPELPVVLPQPQAPLPVSPVGRPVWVVPHGGLPDWSRPPLWDSVPASRGAAAELWHWIHWQS
jgi:hypothetical protein